MLSTTKEKQNENDFNKEKLINRKICKLLQPYYYQLPTITIITTTTTITYFDYY